MIRSCVSPDWVAKQESMESWPVRMKLKSCAQNLRAESKSWFKGFVRLGRSRAIKNDSRRPAKRSKPAPIISALADRSLRIETRRKMSQRFYKSLEPDD